MDALKGFGAFLGIVAMVAGLCWAAIFILFAIIMPPYLLLDWLFPWMFK
jgi:hypothetical protein